MTGISIREEKIGGPPALIVDEKVPIYRNRGAGGVRVREIRRPIQPLHPLQTRAMACPIPFAPACHNGLAANEMDLHIVLFERPEDEHNSIFVSVQFLLCLLKRAKQAVRLLAFTLTPAQ